VLLFVFLDIVFGVSLVGGVVVVCVVVVVLIVGPLSVMFTSLLPLL